MLDKEDSALVKVVTYEVKSKETMKDKRNEKRFQLHSLNKMTSIAV